MKAVRQTTLCDEIALSGVGVHSGLPVSLVLHPADANSGINFIRTGLRDRCDREVRAELGAVTATEFATVLGDAAGPLVSTVEHVLAALRGLGVDNATVEIDGPEAPIMDGSAAAFVAAIDQGRIETLAAPRRFIRALKPVRVATGNRLWGTAALRARLPDRGGNRIRSSADRPPIARVRRPAANLPFRHRTCAHVRVHARRGPALGRRLCARRIAENTLVVTENRVLNPEGTRFPNEFVRHKVLDASRRPLRWRARPLLGAYRSVLGGHKLNWLSRSVSGGAMRTLPPHWSPRPMRRTSPRPEHPRGSGSAGVTCQETAATNSVRRGWKHLLSSAGGAAQQSQCSAIDRHYHDLRLAMQGAFHELGIAA